MEFENGKEYWLEHFDGSRVRVVAHSDGDWIDLKNYHLDLLLWASEENLKDFTTRPFWPDEPASPDSRDPLDEFTLSDEQVATEAKDKAAQDADLRKTMVEGAAKAGLQ